MHMSLEIRLATLEEAALVHRVMQSAFAEYADVLNPPSGANRETIADVEQAMCDGGAIIAWNDQTAIGSARFRLEPDYFYVGRVAVLPEYRGAGIGRALMEYLEQIAVEKGLLTIHLGVRMSLPQNLRFYEKLGYSVLEVGLHPKGGDQVATLAKHIRVIA
jgi:ribosomal protein S18 acetylase RimI-like enzyme